MRAAAALCLGLVACGFDPRGAGAPVDAPPGDDGPDLDGPQAIDGPLTDAAVDAVDAPTCTPSCSGFILTTCGPTGPVTTDCPAGCDGAALVCRVFQPSNDVPTAEALASTTDLTVPAGRAFVFNSDTGEILSWAHGAGGYTDRQLVRPGGDGVMNGIAYRGVTQAEVGAPVIGTWSVRSFSMPDATSWVDLRGARAAAIVSAGPVVVRGWIDAGGGYDLMGGGCQICPGAGGGRGATGTTAATGCAPGGNGTGGSGPTQETGGAGGGMSVPGGAGGGGPLGTAIATCAPATLDPLIGGSGGGRGHNQTPIALGGGGGGAFQLVSLTSLTVEGAGALIDAAGEGGDGSSDDPTTGGGGGGAGGALLLEAPSVTVAAEAIVTANGGGGGAGNTTDAGEDGRNDATPAAGGTAPDGTTTSGGAGGAGGTGTGAGTNPGAGRGGVDGGGGGGGAAGRIRVNSYVDRPRILNGTFSPPNTTGLRPSTN
ncbi:MAG: hypothetical protein KBG48_17470 [Kofleriaceae bacterium]|jgi:hypothetical protein|nr:hypothetical protein [Kofleriaceae bacterium]MBP9859096.1 hypothetical protein [Kofleriaceae bacterium]